jgi:hypothetical protein
MKLTARQRRWAIAGIACSAIFYTTFLGLIVAAHAASPVAICGLSGTDAQHNCVEPNSDGSITVQSNTGTGTLDVNIDQVGGVSTDIGLGNAGAATIRVAPATDTLVPLGTAGTAATSISTVQGIQSMVPVAAGALGSGTGGTLSNLKTCDLHAKYDASDNGAITLITGVSSRKIYICGYILATGGTATNLSLREGSDANCATNGAALTPLWQLVANDKIGVNSGFWTGLVTSTNAYYVCVNASAGNAHQAEIWYTTQ